METEACKNCEALFLTESPLICRSCSFKCTVVTCDAEAATSSTGRPYSWCAFHIVTSCTKGLDQVPIWQRVCVDTGLLEYFNQVRMDLQTKLEIELSHIPHCLHNITLSYVCKNFDPVKPLQVWIVRPGWPGAFIRNSPEHHKDIQAKYLLIQAGLFQKGYVVHTQTDSRIFLDLVSIHA